MPRLKTESFGGGDQSWLGSTHGIGNARTEKLDPSEFTKATHYPDGFIRSGQPLAKVDGVVVPYVAGASDGSEVLAGFLLTDQATDGAAQIGVPVLDHGRIKTAKVPGSFTAPTAANDKTTCVYV